MPKYETRIGELVVVDLDCLVCTSKAQFLAESDLFSEDKKIFLSPADPLTSSKEIYIEHCGSRESSRVAS